MLLASRCLALGEVGEHRATLHLGRACWVNRIPNEEI